MGLPAEDYCQRFERARHHRHRIAVSGLRTAAPGFVRAGRTGHGRSNCPARTGQRDLLTLAPEMGKYRFSDLQVIGHSLFSNTYEDHSAENLARYKFHLLFPGIFPFGFAEVDNEINEDS